MSDLTQQKCVPCESDVPPMTDEEIEELKKDVPKWRVVELDGVLHLKRSYDFEDFAGALDFTNLVGEMAEE